MTDEQGPPGDEEPPPPNLADLPPPGAPPPGPPPSWAQPPWAQSPYGQAPYGQIPYGQAPYGQAPYGQYGAPQPGTPYQQPYSQPPFRPYEPPQPPRPVTPPRTFRGWASYVAVIVVVSAVIAGGVAALLTSRSQQTIITNRAGAPSSKGVVVSNVQAVLARVLPAVVSIDTSSYRTSTGGYVEGAGTGMIISANGTILTNNHVIAGARTITVTLYGQTSKLPATVVGTDPSQDVALIRVEDTRGVLPTVRFGNSSSALQGDGVLAIGNALALAGGPSVTEGIVSAKNRSLETTNDLGTLHEHLTGLLQTDAPINPGNSGGPLVNSSGDVIGMNTAVAESSAGNAPAQNIGFAIAIDRIRPIITRLEAAARS